MKEHELKKISNNLVEEDIEAILEKAYCTIIFTHNYVIKIFCRNKREYNAKAIYYEYMWDKNMPLLSARFVEHILFNGIDSSALILNRLPLWSNLLYQLAHDGISNKEILQIGILVKKLICSYSESEMDIENLYENYILNLKLQIEKLKGKIDSKLITDLRKLQDNQLLLNIFRENRKTSNVALIHGNLFSGNIFYYKKELVVIDPISYNHVARKSFPHMDLATFLVDIRIFKSELDYFNIYKKMAAGMQIWEVILMQLYLILKLLVRLRFAYMEINLRDEYSDVNVNDIIINNGKQILKEELNNIVEELKEYFG